MLLAIILSALYATGSSQKPIEEPYDYYVKTTNIECIMNPEWIENGSCSLKPVNWERTLINAAFDIKRTLKNVSFHLQVFRRESRYVPFLFDFKKNACDILNQKRRDFLSKVVLGMFTKFTNMNPSCPVKVGHVDVKNFYFESKSLPLPIPPGMYKVQAIFLEESLPHTVAVLKVYHMIVQKKRTKIL